MRKEKPVYMTSPMINRQTQTRLRAFSRALQMQAIIVLHQDVGGVFDLAENLPAIWPDIPMLGRSAEDALPPELAAPFMAARTASVATGEEQSFEFALSDAIRPRQFEARVTPDETGLIVIITDITDSLVRSAAFASLLREVSHRSKNLLAIVQSVAMQTANHSDSTQDFLDKFRGRLHALSSTQDLVTESDWRGTFFQSLVTSQIQRMGRQAMHNMRITGDNPMLTPNASLHIGLAIHELAANAMLHGALASELPADGHVWIDASITRRKDAPPDLVIEWRETGIDADKVKRTPRFGTLVLERIVPLSVGGTARLSISGDSVVYRLVVPSDQFEA